MAFSAACSARGVMLKLVSRTSTVALGTGCEQAASRINDAKTMEREGIIRDLLS